MLCLKGCNAQFCSQGEHFNINLHKNIARIQVFLKKIILLQLLCVVLCYFHSNQYLHLESWSYDNGDQNSWVSCTVTFIQVTIARMMKSWYSRIIILMLIITVLPNSFPIKSLTALVRRWTLLQGGPVQTYSLSLIDNMLNITLTTNSGLFYGTFRSQTQ